MSTYEQTPPDLDRMGDIILAYDPARGDAPAPEPSTLLEAWSASIAEIFQTADLRLDATYFDRDTATVLKGLLESGVPLDPLSDVAAVVLPNQFTRIWAKDRAHGIPYLNATDLLSLLSLGSPAGGQRYLSHVTETDIESLIIRKGWLLMTCSGTIGRVIYVPERLDGWAATHDLIRIIPKHKGIAGYLYAWLTRPAAQTQILHHTHGGQIDHVTGPQIATVLIPRLPDAKIKRIHQHMLKALRAREAAMESISTAWEML